MVSSAVHDINFEVSVYSWFGAVRFWQVDDTWGKFVSLWLPRRFGSFRLPVTFCGILEKETCEGERFEIILFVVRKGTRIQGNTDAQKT